MGLEHLERVKRKRRSGMQENSGHRGRKKKEVEGRWRRTTWPGEAASSKGSESWEIEQCSGKSARSRHAAYKYCNSVVCSVHRLIVVGDLLQ